MTIQEILLKIVDEIQEIKNEQHPDFESQQENHLYYREFREEINKLNQLK